MTDVSKPPAPERLTVKNFACLKSVEIEIRAITILIGEQAAGKSLLAKILHFFKGFVPSVRGAIYRGETPRSFMDGFEERFKDAFPTQYWGQMPFVIQYSCGEERIVISRREGSAVDIELSGAFRDVYAATREVYLRAFKALDAKAAEEDVEFADDRKWRAVTDMNTYLRGYSGEHFPVPVYGPQHFIPAGRSFFANLENIYTFLETGNHVDSYLQSFGSYYGQVKESSTARATVHQGIMEELVTGILRGSHFRKDKKDWITNVDGREIPVALASSGQQEALPLCMVLAHSIQWARGSPTTYYIEEPEAHLFPRSQRAIVELIALAFSSRSGSSRFFITTHSPYVLTAFNNLLQAGKLYETANTRKAVAIGSIVPRYFALSRNNLSAYSVDSQGVTDLMCAESGLIDASKIDEVSSDLAIQFDHLLDLE